MRGWELWGALIAAAAIWIIGHLNHNLIALMVGIQLDHPDRGLAEFTAFLGRFDAVADRVANEMSERLGDGVENPFVEICFLAADHEFHFAPALP